jgi:hypothetical protein
VKLKPCKKYDNDYFYGESNKEGEVHGRGIYLWGNGERYEGEWKHDKKSGKGRLFYVDGDIY